MSWEKIKLKDSYVLTVCDMCLRSCCWRGEFMCDDAREASTVDLSIEVLKKIQKHLDNVYVGEHSDYWKQAVWEA